MCSYMLSTCHVSRDPTRNQPGWRLSQLKVQNGTKKEKNNTPPTRQISSILHACSRQFCCWPPFFWAISGSKVRSDLVAQKPSGSKYKGVNSCRQISCVFSPSRLIPKPHCMNLRLGISHSSLAHWGWVRIDGFATLVNEDHRCRQELKQSNWNRQTRHNQKPKNAYAHN